jgi:hypothetical protein
MIRCSLRLSKLLLFLLLKVIIALNMVARQEIRGLGQLGQMGRLGATNIPSLTATNIPSLTGPDGTNGTTGTIETDDLHLSPDPPHKGGGRTPINLSYKGKGKMETLVNFINTFSFYRNAPLPCGEGLGERCRTRDNQLHGTNGTIGRDAPKELNCYAVR